MLMYERQISLTLIIPKILTSNLPGQEFYQGITSIQLLAKSY